MAEAISQLIHPPIPRLAKWNLASWFGLKLNAGLAWLRTEKWLLIVAGCSVTALVLTCQPYMHHKLARRATSVVNANDFSSRNRLVACEAALQIMVDHPIIGVGWHRVRSRFEYLYAPFITTDSWSIIVNDYLTLGMALGIPALVCFISLVWFLWNRTAHYNWLESRKLHLHFDQKVGYSDKNPELCLREAYRGALIVFFIGFWLDGGLFKLALAVPFWLILELSNQPLMKADECE